ncbi:hypothetical protein CA260_10975 [Dyella jiangningensis]|uniref:Uncharacterized protein n=2 Tax=Dyella jiangningensis TaxID=1379159 RepID=A0A328P646_9GAMM|nr:hypothetical protein CA260_10975 [Dyella jiangningensis]
MRDASCSALMGHPSIARGRNAGRRHGSALIPPSIAAMARDRLDSQNVIGGMYYLCLERCAACSDPLMSGLDPARLRAFRLGDAPFARDLRRMLTVFSFCGRIDSVSSGIVLPQIRALADCMKTTRPDGVDSLRLVLSAEQVDETAWGLLLALVKDAELTTLSEVTEALYAAQRMQRQLVQQHYEELMLLLSRMAEGPYREHRRLY